MGGKIFIIIIISLIIGIGSGFFLGQMNNTDKTIELDINNTFEAGWAAAEKRIAETSAYFQLDQGSQDKITQISGAIEEIDNNNLIIKTNPLSPLSDPSLNIRDVLTNGNTLYNKIIFKDEIEYQKEIDEYYKKYSEYKNRADLPDEPLPSETKVAEANFNDLEIGQRITVNANEDIKEKKNFTAKSITINNDYR